MRRIPLTLCTFLGLATLTLAGCSGALQWRSNCDTIGCGSPPTAPDGGWGPGTCTTQALGAACTDAEENQSCTLSADPCVSGLICGTSNPNCGGVEP